MLQGGFLRGLGAGQSKSAFAFLPALWRQIQPNSASSLPAGARPAALRGWDTERGGFWQLGVWAGPQQLPAAG